MKNNKKIIIELDNIRARKNRSTNNSKNHFYLKEYFKEIKKHIEVRIDEVKEDNSKKDFFDSRMHDSILIYGTRGNGKTTIMINLQDIIEEKFKDEKDSVKVIDVIDPTVLEPTEDFLLIILSAIMNSVEKHHKASDLIMGEEHHREKFYHNLEDLLHKIESTHSTENQTEIFDKFYSDKTAVGLAKSLHDFFHNVTKIFGVDVLVIPIDDIDMNMVQGYNISETIRKYLSSPYIIPIVSFNIKQMRAIVKYNKYKAFGIRLTDKELEHHKDLDFLYSIPTDYLSSIFPPDRRVMLRSIFNILEKYEQEDTEKLYFHLSSLSTENIILDNILIIITSIIFESNSSIKNKSSFVSDYLTYRSTRDFFKDCHSIMNAMIPNKKKKKKKEKIYSLDYEKIRNRYSPDDKGILIKDEQALAYLWDEFIDLAKKNLSNTKKEHSLVNNNWAKTITEVIYEDQTDEVNKKIYRRLWLQNYYLKQKNTKIKKLFKNKLEISKSYKLTGAIELAMRSYIPMYLFETIIKNQHINYSMIDLISLKELATKSMIDVAYDLSTFEIMLQKRSSKELTADEYKVFGSVVISSKKDELYKAEYNIPYLFKLRNQDQIFEDDNYISHQIYFLSIFKSLALLIDITNLKEEINKDKDKDKIKLIKILEKYRVNLPCLNDDKFVTKYVEKIQKDILNIVNSFLNIELEKSTFGILEIVEFSKNIVDYFFEIRSNTNLGYSYSEINFKKHIWFCKKINQKIDDRKKSCFICDKNNNFVKLKIKQEDNKFNIQNDDCMKFIDYTKDDKIYNIEMIEENSISKILIDYPEIDVEIGTLSEYFDYPLSAYLTSFSQALLISLIKSNKNLNNQDIYTRNSFHGANITILNKKKDNLFKKLEKFKWLEKQIKLTMRDFQYQYSEFVENFNNIELSQKSSFFFQNLELLNEMKIKNKNAQEIDSFFTNLKNIDFFNILYKNYKDIEPVEKCDFINER